MPYTLIDFPTEDLNKECMMTTEIITPAFEPFEYVRLTGWNAEIPMSEVDQLKDIPLFDDDDDEDDDWEGDEWD